MFSVSSCACVQSMAVPARSLLLVVDVAVSLAAVGFACFVQSVALFPCPLKISLPACRSFQSLPLFSIGAEFLVFSGGFL